MPSKGSARRRRSLLSERAAALSIAVLVGVPSADARAQSTDFEVGPWLGWAAGWK